MENANNFLASLHRKSASKLLFVIDAAESANDAKLFKKLNDEIWEFRSKYMGKQNRLSAIWDKNGEQETLVIATHGFVKKSRKTPIKEILKAEELRQLYFSSNTPK